MSKEGKYNTANKTPGSTSDNRLRKLLHQQSTYMWSWTHELPQPDIDTPFFDKLGVTKTDSEQLSSIHTLVNPLDRYTWLRFLAKLRNAKPIGIFDIQFQKKNGKSLWFRVTTDNEAINTNRFGLITDITNDKTFLEQSRSENARLEKSTQNNFGLNIIVDEHLNIKHIHNAGSILRHLPKSTISELTIDSLIEKSSRNIFLKAFQRALNEPDKEIKTELTTNPVYTRHQKYLEIIIINKCKDQQINGLIIDARDITPRREMEKHLKKQKEEYWALLEEYEAQNTKIKIKNEILEAKTDEITQINQKLRQSENRFLSLARIVNEAVTIKEDGKTVFVSSRLAEITGYPIEELYNFEISSLAEKPIPQNAITLEEAGMQTVSFWGLAKNGERKFFTNIHYTENEPGLPTYDFTITSDRTKEKIQNELLRENEMKLKATLESLDKYIIVIDNKGYIINYYEPDSSHTKVFPDNVSFAGIHYTELPLPDSFIERVLQAAIDVQQKGTTQQVELPLKIHGKARWYYLSISLRHNTNGQNIGWTLVMDDISHIKATEMQLKNREAQLFSLINHFPDIVGLKDAEGRWIIANNKLRELYGIKQQPYLLKTSRELAIVIPENKRIYNKCHETDITAWHKKEQIKYDMVFDRPDETPRSFEIIKVPVFNNEGNAEWLLLLGRDLTDRNIMTQELKKAKEEAERADQLKTAFLTNMLHELRTPLNGILGFSQILSHKKHDPEEEKEFLQIIWESSNILLGIINDIIDLSRMETGQININIRPTNIKDLLKGIYEYFETKYDTNKINFNLVLPTKPEQIIIDTDGVRLQQVINNLLTNAFKFTHKGEINLTVQINTISESLEIEVNDSGIGIDEKHYDTIFERFRQVEEGFTRDYGGAGLGLAISKKICEILSGKIIVSSEKGKGTSFVVKLPYINSGTITTEAKMPPDIGFLQNKTVLAVEDDAGSYLLLKSILGSSGCKLIHAKNGKDALETLEEQPNIDVVLMDIQMPIMDGIEATRKIRKRDQKIPIIAQTAHAFTNDKEKCEQAGCSAYITKPIRFNELFNALYKTLKQADITV
jgi:PAS domain S-box-containing protein